MIAQKAIGKCFYDQYSMESTQSDGLQNSGLNSP